MNETKTIFEMNLKFVISKIMTHLS